MLSLIRPGDAFFDIGAAQGWYTLLFSRVVGDEGSVLAFEPDPVNFHFLECHVSINRRENVQTFEYALDSTSGTSRFGMGTGSGTGRLSEAGDLEVKTRRLDEVVAESCVEPTHMKIDVEGAELRVLEGGVETLKRCKPTIFLSTHGEQVHRDCCQFLSELGYSLEPILGEDLENSAEICCR